MRKRLSGFVACLLSALCVTLAALTSVAVSPSAASAQATHGAKGWCTALPGGSTACYGDPGSACHRQFQEFAAAHAVEDAMTDSAYWSSKICNWHYTTGSGPLGAFVTFNCINSIWDTAKPPGICIYYYEPFELRTCNCDNGGIPNASTPYPIDILTGVKRFSAEDFSTDDGSLRLRRRFASWYGQIFATVNRPPDGLANWQYDFQVVAELDSGWNGGSYNVVVFVPGAGAYTFHRNSDGSFSPYGAGNAINPQTDYKLEFVGTWPTDLTTVVNSSSTWKLHGPDDETWTFSTFAEPGTGKYTLGRPTLLTERSGHTLTFAYSSARLSSVTDNYGKSISFTWGGTNPDAITQATLPGGKKINYTYNVAAGGASSLARVDWLDALGAIQDTTTYENANATYGNFVTGIFDKNGTRRWTVTYDASGHATASYGPGGAEEYQVSYGDPTITNLTRTVTNPNGVQTTYTYQRSGSGAPNAKISSVANAATANVPASTASDTYGSDGFLATATDQEGRVAHLTHDARGMPAQVVEAYGTTSARTTTTTWNTTFHVPVTVVAPGLTTTYAYDTQGRPTSVTQTDTTTFTTPYATNGRTRTWTYTWNTAGQILTATDPASHTTTYTYNTDGYLATVTDALSHVTTVTAWDWRGAPTSVIDPNGVVTTFTYDIRGRPLTTTLNPGASQSQYQFSYTAMGDVAQMTLPGGGYLQYAYDDARRVTTITNNRGETRNFTYDANDDPLTDVIKDSGSTITRQTSAAYDELGRIIQSIGAAGATTQKTTLAYDKVSNPTSVTDPLSHQRQNTFDPLNRVITRTDPESHTVQLAYDGQDNLKTHTDGRSLATSRTIDGFGQVIQEVSPDRGTRSYWYDAAGNLTKLVDGDGLETDYAYDAVNRRTAMTFPAASAENVAYAYDSTAGGNAGVGRLTSVTEESGSTSLTYDAQGRVVTDAKVIQGRGYQVGYSYDANGKVTQIVYPSGRIVTFTRATDGQVTAVATQANSGATAQNVATSVVYAPFGPLKSFTYGNGLNLTRTYDQNYWLTRIQVAGTSTALDLGFQYFNDGNLSEVDDNAATGRSVTSVSYTNSGRLSGATGPWGQVSYTYDAAGNRTSNVLTVGGVTTTNNEVPQTAANRLDTIKDAGSVVKTNFTWRTGGDLSTAAAVSGDTWSYNYNARKRLVQVLKNSIETGTYGYDYLDRRVWRNVDGTGGGQTQYVFDQDDHLLAEHDGSAGSVLKEYVWLGDTPLAVIDSTSGTATTYYISAGRLSEPQQLIDGSGSKVWDAYLDPYGTAQTFSTASASIDLRLPGQWTQAETGGLSQNYHRDYSPALGRYIEADPLGIDAGQNVYGYVDGNPLDLTDPTGQSWAGALGSAGALLGGGVVAAGSVVADVYSGGFNLAATPTEVGLGAAGGGAAGFALGLWIDHLSQASSSQAKSQSSSNQDKGDGVPLRKSTAAEHCPDEECEDQNFKDRTYCQILKATGGRRKAAICYGTATVRHAECIRGGGVHAIMTPLYRGN